MCLVYQIEGCSGEMVAVVQLRDISPIKRLGEVN